MAIIFCFCDDRARSTWEVRNVNHVFRTKNLRSNSHSCKWNKSTSHDLHCSRSPSQLRCTKITLSLCSREINKSRFKKRSTCGKSKHFLHFQAAISKETPTSGSTGISAWGQYRDQCLTNELFGGKWWENQQNARINLWGSHLLWACRHPSGEGWGRKILPAYHQMLKFITGLSIFFNP